MNSEDIFIQLLNHMLEGVMIHEQLTNYYDFLNLKGYKECHEYHYLKEANSYRKMYSYCIDHFEKLLQIDIPYRAEVIPQSWYNHTKSDVDITTKRNAIRQGIEKWKDWEAETKLLYESLYSELANNGLIGYALLIEECIRDVDEELIEIKCYCLDNKSIDYDLTVIIPKQHHLHKHYMKEIKNILC